jgi:signal transduction histidine kinase
MLQGPKTNRAELHRMGLALRKWERVRCELVNYTKDGREFCVELDIVPIADENGSYTHWVSIQRDVTHRKAHEADAAMRDAQRTESLGTLSTGIAHDFNNIVASILGNVSIARDDIAEGLSALDALEQIAIAGRRARGLIQQILAYSRRQPQVFTAQPIGPLVLEATNLLRSTLPAGVSLAVGIPELPLQARMDATQIVQVLINLGTNAWHALKDGQGTVGVVAAAVTLDAAACAALQPSAWLPEGRYLSITVEDDGSGMDAPTRARIFDPYFTTKAIGLGTGLGLSVVWGILAAHGGAIGVSSEPGRGTVFNVLLPLLEADANARSGAPRAVPLRGVGQRVMVVDDDDVVVIMLSRMLSRAGFAVTSVTDPREALAVLQANPHAFDVVVTDLNMPGLSGLQLATAVRLLRPDLPVLLGSGYVSEELAATASAAGVVRVFRKEYALEELGDLVQQVLARVGETE